MFLHNFYYLFSCLVVCSNYRYNMEKKLFIWVRELLVLQWKNMRVTQTQGMNALLLLLSCFSRVRLCNRIDGSPSGSTVPGILQARTLERVAISFSSAWKWKVKVKSLSCVRLLATPWTGAYQAPPSMGFSRQEYWSGVPLPSPNIHSNNL